MHYYYYVRLSSGIDRTEGKKHINPSLVGSVYEKKKAPNGD